MRRIFVYESFSAQRGGSAPRDADLLDAGRAMRDAIVLDLLRLPELQVTCAVGELAPLPVRHERLEGAARAQAEREVDFVRRQQARHDGCWIVAPETGGLLEQLQAAVAPERRIGCDPAAIRVAASKRSTLALLAAHGVPTPRLYDGTDGWIVKPDDGAGCTATRRHARLAAAQADQAARPGTVLEPFVPGEPLSVSMIVAPDGVRTIAFNRQHIREDEDNWLRDDGVEVAALDERRDARVPALRALGGEVARALPGLRGFVGIDVVCDPARGPVLVEINPRTTCAWVGLSARLRRNVAREVLDATVEADRVAAA
jgi:predicted ATP-grasp superfamily ATP-dependent carboligase